MCLLVVDINILRSVADKRDLTKELEKKGYQVVRNMDEIAKVKSGKLAGLTAE